MSKKLIRYEQRSIYTKLLEKAYGDFWTHNSVSYKDDLYGVQHKFDEKARQVFLKTISFQSLMDNDIVGIYTYLAKFVDDQTLQLLYLYIAQNESIHQLSYSYGLQQTFGNEADDILSNAENEPAVLQRMYKEEQVEDDFVSKFNIGEATIKDFVNVVIHAYLLEQIKFPVSFFVTFKLNDTYNGAINGFSQALKEIAQDELNTHVVTNMNVLKQLIRENKVDKEFVEKLVVDRINEIINEEEIWAEFLFDAGEPKGLNKKLYKYLVEYFSDEALRKLGFNKMFNVIKNSEISWFNNYRDINKSVVAQQETDSVGYQSLIINDLNKFDERV